MSTKLLNGVLDVFKVGEKETLIIRGIIDLDSFGNIQVAPYQREVLPGAKVKTLMNALKYSSVPDVELGMRGDKHRVSVNEKGGDTFYLQDDVFVIDGLQRISAAKKLIAEDPTAKPRVGAVVHFDTTEEWETERFRILNQERSKLNGNILLRNLRPKSEAVDMVFRLCEDETFVLFNRVQWTQRMARTEILPATVVSRTVGFLHSRFGPGRGGCSPTDLAAQLDTTMKLVGRTTMRDNVKTFFDILDECFGVKKVVYHHGAAFIRSNFLICLADLFTRHTNFWRGNRLFVEKDLKMKISKFPINDPEVVRLASSGGKAKEILYSLLLEHVNSGKRTRRLQLVDGMEPKGLEAEEVSIPEERESQLA
jgi:hypothetical protein